MRSLTNWDFIRQKCKDIEAISINMNNKVEISENKIELIPS